MEALERLLSGAVLFIVIVLLLQGVPTLPSSTPTSTPTSTVEAKSNPTATPTPFVTPTRIIIPIATKTPAPPATTTPKATPIAKITTVKQTIFYKVHTVQKGETLAGIAAKYGTTTAALRRLNHLDAPISALALRQAVTPNAPLIVPYRTEPLYDAQTHELINCDPYLYIDPLISAGNFIWSDGASNGKAPVPVGFKDKPSSINVEYFEYNDEQRLIVLNLSFALRYRFGTETSGCPPPSR